MGKSLLLLFCQLSCPLYFTKKVQVPSVSLRNITPFSKFSDAYFHLKKCYSKDWQCRALLECQLPTVLRKTCRHRIISTQKNHNQLRHNQLFRYRCHTINVLPFYKSFIWTPPRSILIVTIQYMHLLLI